MNAHLKRAYYMKAVSIFSKLKNSILMAAKTDNTTQKLKITDTKPDKVPVNVLLRCLTFTQTLLCQRIIPKLP